MNFKDTDYAWAAGFVDGEGSFSVRYYPSKKSYSTEFQIGQVNEEVLRRFQFMFGGSVRQRENKGAFENGRQLWMWRIYGKESEEAVQKILPYLHLKKEQAQLYLEVRQSIRSRRACNKNPLPENEKSRRLEIVDRMRVLNKRGAA